MSAFIIWYPGGQIVLSRVEGIVTSINGFWEILCLVVSLKAFFKPSRFSQLIWIVPWSNCYLSPFTLLKHLNLGNPFKAILNLVAAPLYSTLFTLFSCYLERNLSAFGINF